VIDASYRKLVIINITNPAAPTLASTFGGDTLSLMDAYAGGNYAYVVGTGGLWVLDVSNPALPTQVGHSAAITHPSSVYVAGSYAFVVGDVKLWVINASIPTNPVVAGTYDMQESSGNVYVSDNYAYVLMPNYGLRVLDISNPANPTLVGQSEFDTWNSGEDVRVAGDYIYIAQSSNGLVILRPTALQVSPAAVTWLAQVGGANPPARTVNVGSTGSAVAWTAALNPAVGWLDAAPLSGTSPTNIALTANIAGLPVGQYNTQLVVTAAAGIGNSPQTIPITLNVVPEVHNLYLPLIPR